MRLKLVNIISKGKYSNLEKQVKELKELNFQLAKELNCAKESFDAKIDEISKLSQALQEKSGLLIEKEELVKDLSTINLQLARELNSTKDSFDAKMGENSKLSQTLQEKTELLIEKEEQVKDLSTTNLQLAQDLDSVKKSLGAKSDEIKKYQLDIQKLTGELFELKDKDSEEIESNEIGEKELRDRIETLEREKLMQIDEKKQWHKQYENLRIECDEIKARNEWYEQRITELENAGKSEIEDVKSHPHVIETDDPEASGILTDSPNVVQTLKIDKVINVRTEEEIDAWEFFQKPTDEIFHIRRELQDAIICDNPLYVCKYCGQMVKISGRNTERGRASFFSHLYDSDKCDLKTTTGVSKALINARKYGEHGESQRHKEIKAIIENALNDENSKKKGVGDVQKEKTVFGLHPLFKWRRPDVYCRYNDLEIVFELQLSTTFACVIAERECFYKMNHIFLVWVFNFDENEKHVDLRNMMMKDIYFENHNNVFIIDKEAWEEGLRRKELVLKCDWLESNGLWHYSGNDNYCSKGEFVTLSDLEYNKTTYKPYYHCRGLMSEIHSNTNDQDMVNTIRLLDEKYERLKKQQEYEEEKRKAVLAALDVDSVYKEYISLDVAIVKKGKYYGIINYKTNKEVLPALYLSIKLWTNRKYFIVEDENYKFSVYDRFGREILKNRYDSIPKFDKGATIVQLNKNGNTLYSVMSYNGSSLNESDCYNHIENTTENTFIVTQETNETFLKGLLSESGNKLIAPSYTYLAHFNENLYHAVKKSKHGIIDRNGKIVLPFKYDAIDSLQDGKAKIVQGDYFEYIDSLGKPIFTKVIPLNSRASQEKRYFMNKWWLFNCGGNPWEKGYDEICHYQGATISFSETGIGYFHNIQAEKSCGIEAVLKEKNKYGLLFAIGSRIVKMNKKQLKRKPEEVKYEIGQTYNLYISCIKTELNLVYVSPIPCFGPTLKNHDTKKKRHI